MLSVFFRERGRGGDGAAIRWWEGEGGGCAQSIESRCCAFRGRALSAHVRFCGVYGDEVFDALCVCVCVERSKRRSNLFRRRRVEDTDLCWILEGEERGEPSRSTHYAASSAAPPRTKPNTNPHCYLAYPEALSHILAPPPPIPLRSHSKKQKSADPRRRRSCRRPPRSQTSSSTSFRPSLLGIPRTCACPGLTPRVGT